MRAQYGNYLHTVIWQKEIDGRSCFIQVVTFNKNEYLKTTPTSIVIKVFSITFDCNIDGKY